MYQPQPGTTVYQTIAYLQMHGKDPLFWFSTRQLADITGVKTPNFTHKMARALQAGFVQNKMYRAQRGRAMRYWAIGPVDLPKLDFKAPKEQLHGRMPNANRHFLPILKRDGRLYLEIGKVKVFNLLPHEVEAVRKELGSKK